ncbi:MAG TPA: hypothetical protein QGF52_03425, partial [Nitrososphaerales archaeon]|nr:hypothetical protein [Nitrososphaerales archaeon]
DLKNSMQQSLTSTNVLLAKHVQWRARVLGLTAKVKNICGGIMLKQSPMVAIPSFGITSC